MSFVKTHQPCTSCDSSDGMSINDDGSTYCFVCQTFTKPEENTTVTYPLPTTEKTHREPSKAIAEAFTTLPTPAIGSRRIARATVERYGVVSDTSNVWFPYHDNDEIGRAHV